MVPVVALDRAPHRAAGCGRLLVVIVVALPVFSLRLGLDDAGTDPASSRPRTGLRPAGQGLRPRVQRPVRSWSQRSTGRPTAPLRTSRRRPHPASRGSWRATPRGEPCRHRRGRGALPEHRPAGGADRRRCSTSSAAEVVPAAEAGTRPARPDRRRDRHPGRLLQGLARKLPQFIAVVVILASCC